MELYACLVEMDNSKVTGETLRFITMCIAKTRVEATEMALEDVYREHGAHLRTWKADVDAHEVRRGKLEEAARQVLEWKAPDRPTH